MVSKAFVPVELGSAAYLLASCIGGSDPERHAVTHPAGEWLFREGELVDRVLFITSGRVELSTLRGSTRVALSVLAPGDLAGLPAVITGTPTLISGRSLTDVRGYSISRATLEKAMEGDPLNLVTISQLLSARLDSAFAVLRSQRMIRRRHSRKN